jgi:hypothetical protein
MKRILSTAILSLACICGMNAASVKVTMNAVSTTMTLTDKATGNTVNVGEPTSKVYSFDAPAGEYILTGYATNGTTVNGTIVLTITDEAEQEITVLTNTAYVTNKDADGNTWVEGTDYTLDVNVVTREGVKQTITIGDSSTEGRKTFLALSGNSYFASFIPNAAHQEEGYMTIYKSATLTSNVTVSAAIPLGADYSITVPEDANFQLGIKFAHFTAFTSVEPMSTEISDGVKKINYRLANSQVYNYRTWKEGGLTQAGYFTMSTTAADCPVLAFQSSDYEQFGAKAINHDVNSNLGYETGDIFVNINEKGYLNLNVGDTYDAHAMRTWELTDNSSNNYFIEPDFHYTVIDVNGNPSTGVIEIENSDTTTDPWSTIKAVGPGTAIVLVTYDAIAVNYYSKSVKKEYLGGQNWGAIWPENTAAYVVTVGASASSVEPNMVINSEYNTSALKNAGIYVDAEHDVFYYLDTEAGANYTFTPVGAAKIEIAYPEIGEHMATYKGFGTEGVTAGEDGSYTLLLKEGRQIVRLTDAAGNATYQVLTAKKCHREITNASREGSAKFQPGDKVSIQYSGLRHPANKLAGIYNMSAYVTYNGVPNGTSLYLGSGQYTFGSVASAQAVTIEIPSNYDLEANPDFVMDEGVIQVNGFGDPIGNHRLISRTAGRAANFTAVSHKTYFGMLPDVRIALTPVTNYTIKIQSNVEGVTYTLSREGVTLTANEDGTYTNTYGTYSLVATKEGYRCYRNTFVIDESSEGDQVFVATMEQLAENGWDGKSTSKPEADEDGVYQIGTGAELAWYAQDVNGGNNTTKAVLTADIDLGNFDWTPIGGGSTVKAYKGEFDGKKHTISGLYINNSTVTYQGLFGYVYGSEVSISNLTVNGEVTAKQYVSGIAAYINGATINRCVNNANVTSANTTSTIGGVVGGATGSTAKITNCYNTGNITGINNVGGVVGSALATTTITNVYNIGEIVGTSYVGACAGGSAAKTLMTNAFALKEYTITSGHTLVTEEQMRSGEVAYKLGAEFGQKIGVEAYPVLDGAKVFYNSEKDSYYNATTAVEEIESEDATVVGYYDLQGRMLSKPQSGINIVRMSDGTVRKVYIKY